MDSKTMVDTYEAKMEGQQLLWRDDDLVLRNTPFKKISDDFDKQALIHWWMNVYSPDGYGELKTPYEIYSTWSNGLYCFKYVKTSGYMQETSQTGVEVCFYRDDPLDEQIKQVKMWLPYIKPVTKDKEKGTKAIHLGIFEHTLSEGGVFTLWVYSDTKVVLEKCVYSSIRVLKEFTSLDSALEYIRQNHWYQKFSTSNDYDNDSDDSDDED